MSIEMKMMCEEVRPRPGSKMRRFEGEILGTVSQESYNILLQILPPIVAEIKTKNENLFPHIFPYLFPHLIPQLFPH